MLCNPGKEACINTVGPDWGVLLITGANIYALISNQEDTLKLLSSTLIRWHLITACVCVKKEKKKEKRGLGIHIIGFFCNIIDIKIL